MMNTERGRRWGWIHRGGLAAMMAAGVMAVATLGGSGESASGPKPIVEEVAPSPAAMRIGTVSRTDLLVLYTKSAIHAGIIKDLHRQLDDAKAKGDTKRAREIEKKGGELQEQRHRQLMAQEGIENIIKDTEHIWTEIAAEAGVQAIVIDAVVFKGEGVEIVDVTPLLEKRLKR